jgi:GLPGLI family protein
VENNNKISKTMKRIIILIGVIVCLTAVQVVFGQVSEGSITFEVKVNVHRTLPPDRQEMKSMIPEFRTSKEQLLFNSEESLYKPMEPDEEEDIEGEGMRMRMRTPQNEIYVKPSESKRVALQEFMGKKYLIEDSLKITAWKFGTETKTILRHECKQASYFNEERKANVVAWYTDKIRPFLGPENFNTLPGTVLQIDINEGERVITALAIEPRALKKNELKIPSGGTKTTQAEFRKMVSEQMERMRANGGNIIIRN